MNNKRPKALLHFLLLLGFASHLTSLLPLRTTSAAEQPLVSVVALRVEYQSNPVTIDSPKPRFSWQVQDERRGAVQTNYQIQVAHTERELNSSRLVWDSGKVPSAESIQCVYEGTPLQSAQRYYWHVRVWDGTGQASSWSATSSWEMGLLQPADWKASWIEPDLKEDVSQPGPAPMLRGVFKTKGKVREARAYVTSHGLYELHLNGQRVGDQLFTPGWTSYNKRLQYQTYDVTNLLQNGDNVAGAILGNGWYRGNIGFGGQRNFYGDRLALLLQINVTYVDGSQEIFGSNDKWRATTGPILMSEIYHGEIYDARLEKQGWDARSYDDSNWSPVKVANHRKDLLVAPQGPPVRRIEELKPVKIIKTPAGETVVDMGQNMVGWIRFKCRGTTGTTITLRHAEVLDKNGNFYIENLRAAKQTIKYTLKGGDTETFEPHFTFQGFRYAAVDGYPGELTPDNLSGVVIHSDMARTGEFETSSSLINQLQHNIIWGQKGNFLDVPTDCPQRDERLGWTGDAQVFARTAAFNMDVAGFYTKWLKDMAADQLESGSVPHVIPDVLSGRRRDGGGGATGWADAIVIIPWTVYLTYGDKRVLENQYESMAKWIEYMRRRAGDDYIWDGDPHFGDWLAFATTRADYPGATTSKDFIATAFYAHSTDLMQRIARILGKENDEARFGELFAKIKDAFQKEYVTRTGRVAEDTQTAYVLALQFDLLPEELRATAAKRLAADVRSRGHLTTGFLGTPYICHVLTRFGYLDEAYLLLNREQYPSWLYPVKQGATTIWERWDGQKPDGTFQDRGMNSFNHYAYGAVGDWIYRVAAGIEIDETAPGYKHILIQPQPGGGFTRARASHMSPYGEVSSAWEINNQEFQLVAQVPANTRATVRLPRAVLGKINESGKALTVGNGITAINESGDTVIVEIGSGRYVFAYTMTSAK
jgi:alpha-L-rhamnosidase